MNSVGGADPPILSFKDNVLPLNYTLNKLYKKN